MELKVGQKVLLKKKFLNSFLPSPNSEGEMDCYQDEVVTISYVDKDNWFHIKEDEYENWTFSEDYVEGVIIKELDIE